MGDGSTPRTSLEKLAQHLSVQILVSRRIPLETVWDSSLELFSPFWRLYVQDSSNAVLHTAGRRLRMKRNTVYLIPSWVAFRTELLGSVRQDYLHFHVAGLPRPLVRRLVPEPLELAADPALNVLCGQWRRQLAKAPRLADIVLASALAQASLAGALAVHPTRAVERILLGWRQSRIVRPAVEAMERRLDRPPGNRELARLCGMSEDHFIRRFRAATGLPPARYHRQYRLARASEWLIHTGRTIEDIAQASGFADRFHFSKAFRRWARMSPGAFRRNHHSP